MRRPSAIALSALAAALALPAAAHVGGFTYETLASGHFIDIGASTRTFRAGDLALFDFNLYPNTDPNNPADFDSVYVTVGDDERIMAAALVHRPAGALAVLSYSFPAPGEYLMSARFQKGDQVLAEASFPVQAGRGEGWPWAYAWPLGGVLAGIALASGWRARPGRRPAPGAALTGK